jgi:hypothetical protein
MRVEGGRLAGFVAVAELGLVISRGGSSGSSRGVLAGRGRALRDGVEGE